MTEINYVNCMGNKRASITRKNLSWSRLENFAAVARKGGIAAVAGGSRSGVALISKQIAELESHFEVELKRPKGRGIELTLAGHRLGQLVNEFERGLDDLRADVAASPVAYSIVASNSALHWMVLPRLPQLGEALPAVKWSLYHESSDGICRKVVMGEIDFGICVGPPSSSAVERRRLGEVEYSLFIPAKWGRMGDVKEALSKCPLALPVGGTLRTTLSEWAKKDGGNLNVRLEVDSYLHAAQAVALGSHAAVLPSVAAGSLPKTCVALRLPAPVSHCRVAWLIWTRRTMRTRNGAERVRDSLLECLTARSPK